jgi:hypothetical protein
MMMGTECPPVEPIATRVQLANTVGKAAISVIIVEQVIPPQMQTELDR